MKVSQNINDVIMQDIASALAVFGLSSCPDAKAQAQKMQRLLIAVGIFDEIGYVRGSSFFAAGCLLHCSEEFAYFIMTSFYRSMELKSLLQNRSAQLKAHIQSFFYDHQQQDLHDARSELILRDFDLVEDFKDLFLQFGMRCVPPPFHLALLQGVWRERWPFLSKVLAFFFAQSLCLLTRASKPEVQLYLKNPFSKELTQKFAVDVRWHLIFPNV